MTKLRIKALLDNEDLLDTSVYSKSGPHYLTELQERPPPKPRLMPRILPQRQVPDKALSTASQTRLHDIILAIASAHPDVFEIKPSHTEGKTTDGLYARKELKTLNPIARDKILDHEIAHAHPADNSLHVWLSDRDAAKVVETGWGQRFCLPFVNKGWVMIYAPRNMDEVETVEEIVKAAARFITGVEI
jgi:hypothetical protein